jgi:hypothetical protein
MSYIADRQARYQAATQKPQVGTAAPATGQNTTLAPPPAAPVGDGPIAYPHSQPMAPAPAPAPAAAGPAGPQADPGLQQSYQSVLQSLINGGSPQQAALNAANSGAVGAAKTSLIRNEGRDRQFMAERAAATGTSGSGGFETGLMGLRQRTNEGLMNFTGQQANIQEAGRRDELLRSLTLAAQMGDSNAARQLQRELGFGQLDLSRNQELDRLGFNYADMQMRGNQNALLALLNGGGGGL